MLKKIQIFLFFTITLLVLIVTGCSNKKDTLKVALDLSDEEWLVFREKIIPEFEREYKISVDAIQVDDQDLHHILKADKNINEVKIDVFSINSQQLQMFVDDKLVDDISSYSQFLSKNIDLRIISGLFFGDRLYSLPLKLNIYGFYSDKKNNSKNNFYPMEFNSFKNFIKKKNKIGEKVNLIIPASGGKDTAIWLYEIIINKGGDPYKLKKRNITTVFSYINDIRPYISKDSFKSNLQNGLNFVKKPEINLIYGRYDLIKPEFIEKIILLGTLKTMTREKHVVDGMVLCVFKDSRNKENAKKFLDYLYSKRVQSILFSDLKWIPLRSDVFKKEDFKLRAQYKIIRKSLLNSVYIKDKQKWLKFEQDINKIFSNVVLKNEPLSKAILEIH